MPKKFNFKHNKTKKGKKETLKKKEEIPLNDYIEHNKLPCYTDLIKQGFKWETNCHKNELDDYCRGYASKGLGIQIRNDAYDTRGQPIEDWIAIFVRKE